MRTKRISRSLLPICALGILSLTAACASVRNERNLKKFGVTYQLKELKKPRSNRVHVLRVDLSNKKIRPAVVIAADPDGRRSTAKVWICTNWDASC